MTTNLLSLEEIEKLDSHMSHKTPLINRLFDTAKAAHKYKKMVVHTAEENSELREKVSQLEEDLENAFKHPDD